MRIWSNRYDPNSWVKESKTGYYFWQISHENKALKLHDRKLAPKTWTRSIKRLLMSRSAMGVMRLPGSSSREIRIIKINFWNLINVLVFCFDWRNILFFWIIYKFILKWCRGYLIIEWFNLISLMLNPVLGVGWNPIHKCVIRCPSINAWSVRFLRGLRLIFVFSSMSIFIIFKKSVNV